MPNATGGSRRDDFVRSLNASYVEESATIWWASHAKQRALVETILGSAPLQAASSATDKLDCVWSVVAIIESVEASRQKRLATCSAEERTADAVSTSTTQCVWERVCEPP